MQVPQAPMERNWLILGRVIRVEQPEAQAQAEQAAVVEAETAAQAQLEESVVGVNAVPAAAGEPGFTIAIAPPPRVTFLTALQNSHPCAGRADTCPYIIASGSFGLLAHFAMAPFRGTDFTHELLGPMNRHQLIVVRHFRRAGGLIVASTERVPVRPYPVPALKNIMCVGFFCDCNYRIAELMVETGNPMLRLVIFRSDCREWSTIPLTSPLVYWDRDRRWVPHGAVAIDSTVLWFDLSWGILSCDIEEELEDMEIYFSSLPRGRGLQRGGAMEDIDSRRCIAVSGNMLRYVEIIIPSGEAAMVSMWSLLEGDNRWEWITNYRVSFEDIWNNDSYVVTGLQRDIPVLAGVCPANPNVVYFDLHQRLFGVNVPEGRVVDYEANQHELVNAQGVPQPQTGSSRYLITWDLLRQGRGMNLGHVSPDLQEAHDFCDEQEQAVQKAPTGRQRKSTSTSNRPLKRAK